MASTRPSASAPGAPAAHRTAALLAALLLAPALAGCLGGEARTEWAFDATQLSDVAALGRTGKGVTVAILDTGVNVGHVALRHLADGVDANGELVAFRDFTSPGHDGVAAAYDDEGHGTHVAGIVAASGSSLGDRIQYQGIDLLGGAPGVRLVVAKVCGAECDGAAIPKAIDWAVAQRADVVNLSLGGNRSEDLRDRLCAPAVPRDECAIVRSIDAAISRGVVVVAAAGNEGPGNADVSLPSDVPGVIAVGAIQEDGSVWAGSSRGDDAGHPCGGLPLPGAQPRCDPHKKPELVAPGVAILSAWTGDKYVRATGTSQATPFVTAAVAIMLEGRPDLKDRAGVEEVKRVLAETAQPVASARQPHDEAAGYGVVQALAAFQAYHP